MSEAQAYYEAYWQNDSAHAWTPSSGRITPDENYLFEKYLLPGSSCLDYGCGNAQRYGRYLIGKGLRYQGFDISEAALAEAQKSEVPVGKLSSSGQTTLADNSMDTAICFEVMEHLMEPQAALKEILRCLKPGGHLLLSVPCTSNYLQRLEFLLTGFWNPGGSPITARREPWRDPHIRFFSPAMLRRLAEHAGGKVAEERGEAFSLRSLPVVWRKEAWHPLFNGVSLPFAWLGRVFPGVFAMRIFIVVQKPAAA